ncbi:MAG: TonB-dependent receptor [Sphingobacteriales bacterium]|nr:MAG: TonB-dependent receptor [Sphingobacteriales bacterium]
MKYLFTLCLLWLAGAVSAQSQIPVYIRLINGVDTTESVNAVVTIKDAQGRQVFAENVYVQDTFFATENTRYILSTTALGLKPVQTDLSVKQVPVNLDVRLQSTSNELKSVVIVARKPFVRLEDDKEIVDAEPLAAASSSAYEVLEKTPGVVAIDGNVYLNSSTPAVIQINGRDIKLRGEELSALLKSLPANSIIRVEVLRTPSAKYDASSSGGILNIVLRKGVRLGRSGSVNVSSQQGVYNTSSAGVSLSQTEGENTSYIGYQYSLRNNYQRLNTLRSASSQVQIDQEAFTRYKSQNHNLRGGVDYALTPNVNLAYDGILSYTPGGNDADNINRILLSGNEVSRIASPSDNRNNTVYFSNVLSSKWKLDSAGSVWDNIAEYKLYADDGTQHYRNQIESPSGNYTLGQGTRNSISHIITLQTDYTGQLRHDWKVELGARFDMTLGRTRADFETDTNGNGFETNLFQSSHFNFQQRITAAYAQISKTIWGITIKPGLRVENTFMDGLQTYPQRSDFTIARTDLFPYLYLRRNLWKMFKTSLVANLTYRRSIERPGFDLLNPAPRYIDQFLYEVGNPSLLPQLTDKYELNVTLFDFPVFALGYRDNKNLFTNVSYQDAANGVAYRTYDNLGNQKEYFLRLVAGIPPTLGKYFFFASAEYTYRKYDGQYQGEPFKFERGSWVAFTYHQLKINKTCNLSAYGFWLFKGFERFYELQDFGAINASLTKTFLQGKLSVVASINDILRTNRQTFVLSQPGIYATGNRAEDTRRFGLTLRYNFGIKEKAKPSTSPFGDMDGAGQ